MIDIYKAAPDIDVVASQVVVPGMGIVPVNAFLLHGSEPLLVDTGVTVQRDDFMTALRSVIDPAELRWIWLTHPDPDHTGALSQLLTENPKVRVITTFLAVGFLGLFAPLPMDRVYLVNPGQRITVPAGAENEAVDVLRILDTSCAHGLEKDHEHLLDEIGRSGLVTEVSESIEADPRGELHAERVLRVAARRRRRATRDRIHEIPQGHIDILRSL